MTITSYDLCLAWNWEHDVDFVGLLQNACLNQGVSLYQVTPENLGVFVQDLHSEQIFFRALLDRASDLDVRFMSLIEWACEHVIYNINSYEHACATWDKAEMHLMLIEAGLLAPYTMIIPSYESRPVLSAINLQPFGDQFIVKPAHGSGGNGVITEATSLEHVLAARQEYPADKYLLQAHITPRELDSRLAWFRVIYCTGQVFPCWWHPQTHIYAPITKAEEDLYSLYPLRDITASIADMVRLDLFSTEIAFTPQGEFVVIDYVNDQIDLRLQSKALDGVPDDIVQIIAGCLAELVVTRCKSQPFHNGNFLL